MKFKDVAIGLAIMGTFFLMIVLYAREIYWINNTVDAVGLIIFTAIALIVISQIILFFFTSKVKGLARVQIHIGVAMMMIILSPLVASYSNRMLGGEKEQLEKQAIVQEIRPYSTSIFGIPKEVEFETEGFHLIVNLDGIQKHFKIKTNPFAGSEAGDVISIPFKIGYWGYEYVDV